MFAALPGRMSFLGRLRRSSSKHAAAHQPSRSRALRLEALERREMLSISTPALDFAIPVSPDPVQVVVGYMPSATDESKAAALGTVTKGIGGATIEVGLPTAARGDAELWTLPSGVGADAVWVPLLSNMSIAYVDVVGWDFADAAVAIQDWQPPAGASRLPDEPVAAFADLHDALAGVDVGVADLPGVQSGLADGTHIDSDADNEFDVDAGRALDPRAVDRIDLFSVAEHEPGYAAGPSDLDAAADGLMSAALPTGLRRLALR